nr:hypothetical protein BaRGS_030605 [Batillaria attramentaria]
MWPQALQIRRYDPTHVRSGRGKTDNYDKSRQLAHVLNARVLRNSGILALQDKAGITSAARADFWDTLPIKQVHRSLPESKSRKQKKQGVD